MKCETLGRLTKLIAWLTILVACGNIIGWIFDISILKSIHPNWVTMKVFTSLMFIISGMTILLVYRLRYNNGEPKEYIMLSLLSPVMIAIIAITGLTPLANGLINEMEGAIKTVSPNQPSLGTLLAFTFVAINGFILFFVRSKVTYYIGAFGRCILLIGSLALLGYIVNKPALYYFIPEISTGMAIHTAILFVLIGLAFQFTYKCTTKPNNCGK